MRAPVLSRWGGVFTHTLVLSKAQVPSPLAPGSAGPHHPLVDTRGRAPSLPRGLRVPPQASWGPESGLRKEAAQRRVAPGLLRCAWPLPWCQMALSSAQELGCPEAPVPTGTE